MIKGRRHLLLRAMQDAEPNGLALRPLFEAIGGVGTIATVNAFLTWMVNDGFIGRSGERGRYAYRITPLGQQELQLRDRGWQARKGVTVHDQVVAAVAAGVDQLPAVVPPPPADPQAPRMVANSVFTWAQPDLGVPVVIAHEEGNRA